VAIVAPAPLVTPAPPGYGRAHGRVTVFASRAGATVPLAGATVRPYVPGSEIPWPEPLYGDEAALSPVLFPVAADASGAVSLWADTPERIELSCTYPGYGTQRVVLDLEFPPDYVDPDPDPYPQYATQADLAEHKAAPDDHPGYLTPPEGEALFLPLAHAPGADPHPQYLTPERGDSLFLTEAEADAKYATQGGSGITQDQADLRYEPIDTMYTKSESDLRYAQLTAPDPFPQYLTPTEADAVYATDARVAALEGEVASLQAQLADLRADLTAHGHQNGTVGQIAGPATFPP
jgi:hypothetical protein